MSRVPALVIAGPGTNRDRDAGLALELAGASVQIVLAEGELAKLPKGHELVPGMPAEVFIETGSRSILSYFVKPLTDALARTFRES